MRTPTAVVAFIAGPIRTERDRDGKEVLTHLQKWSRCGWLMTWPFCFHVWYFWRKQTWNPVTMGWEPGTESGIYARTPGYRYDADLGMKWTWGYIGGHWD